MFTLKAGLHHFAPEVFGCADDLINPKAVRERDTLMIACSEQGSAPNNVSFACPGRFSVLQHIGASIPSKVECDVAGVSCDDVKQLFNKHDFRHVIVCGHLGCGVIRGWLQPIVDGYEDIGNFRRRFEKGTRQLVDGNYSPNTVTERCALMICEHVLSQIENLLTHSFIIKRVQAKQTLFHGWVIDDETARVFGYCCKESAFLPI